MDILMEDLQLLTQLIGHQENTIELLHLNASKERHYRIQVVLKDYFSKQSSKLSSADVESDAALIKKIYPDCSLNQIKHSLLEIGNEKNRVRIVLKKLTNDILKSRNSTNESTEALQLLVKNNESPNLEMLYGVVDLCNKTKEQSEQPSIVNNNKMHLSAVAHNSESLCTRSKPEELEQPAVVNNGKMSYVKKSTDEELSSSRSRWEIIEPFQSDVNKQAVENVVKLTELLESKEPKQSTVTNKDTLENFLDESLPSLAETLNTIQEVVESMSAKSYKLMRDYPTTTSPIITNQLCPLRARNDENTCSSSSASKLDNSINSKDSISSTSTVIPNIAALGDADKSNAQPEKNQKAMNHFIFGKVKLKPDSLIYSSKRLYPVISTNSSSSFIFGNSNTKPATCTSASCAPNLCKCNEKNRAVDCASSTNPSISSVLFPKSNTNPKQDLKVAAQNLNKERNDDKIMCPQMRVTSTSGDKSQSSSTVVFETKEKNHTMDFSSGSKIRKASCSQLVSESPHKMRKMNKHMVSSDIDEIENVLMDLQREAVVELPDSIKNTKIDNKLVYRLLEVFPDICPTYVRRLCEGKEFSPTVMEVLISSILETGEYPRRTLPESVPEEKLNFEEQLELMKQVLPEADPDYLQMNCVRFIDKPEELKQFISEAVEKHDYPTMKEYLRKQKVLSQQKQYTTEFNINNFLEIIPDPVAHFKQQERKTWEGSVEAEHYAVCFLRNKYRMIQLPTIREQLRKATSLLSACDNLEKLGVSRMLKKNRALCPMPTPPKDIPLLQEIAFKEHYIEVIKYLEEKKTQLEKQREQFIKDGLVETCQCCYEDAVILSDVYTCEVGCKFCKDCVKKSAEVTFGEGKLNFKCLSNCEADFTLQTLQDVLPPKLFSQIASQKQLEEIKSAGIENLEMCPFCNFAAIPAKTDKLFRCFNPDCMKETCRQCKEPSHIPLRCEEVEKEADVKVRTYIEDKMTEALLRKCWKCGLKFIKSDGCNKMTCSCGAKMCYICNAPVVDYKHFNGPGGDRHNLCPLYSDTHALHESEVTKGAASAKQEMSGNNNDGNLKVDPTADLKQHYEALRKKNPAPVIPGVNAVNFHIPNLVDYRALQQQRIREAVRLDANFHQVHRPGHPHGQQITRDAIIRLFANFRQRPGHPYGARVRRRRRNRIYEPPQIQDLRPNRPNDRQN